MSNAGSCTNCGGSGEVFYFAQAYGAKPVGACNVCQGTGKLLRSCPFCNTYPTVEKWHGSGRHSTLVSCTNEGCHSMPSVHGRSRKEAIERWNVRPGAVSSRGRSE